MSSSPPGSVRRKIIFSNYDDLKNPYYGGGGARAVHEVARRLAARHDVRVVTGPYPASRDEIVDGVSYVRIGGRRVGPKAGQLLFQFLLPARVRRESFDVWVESLTPPFSTGCLQLFTRQPVIALTQVMAGKAMSRKYGLPFAAVERAGLKTYRFAIALSQHLKGELERANPKLRVAVIPNGIDRAQILAPVEKDERHILFLGRVDVEQKGLDLLLDAVKSVAQELPVPLFIAGSGAARDEAFVARRIVELDLGGKVQALGRVEGARKQELLRQALFLAMPSRFEASPLVAVEAFCAQLPVVLFGIPELADLPDSCCLKVPPLDVAALGRAMVRLTRDGDLRRAMGRAGKDYAWRFDWDDLATKYEDFFETALKSG